MVNSFNRIVRNALTGVALKTVDFRGFVCYFREYYPTGIPWVISKYRTELDKKKKNLANARLLFVVTSILSLCIHVINYTLVMSVGRKTRVSIFRLGRMHKINYFVIPRERNDACNYNK